jgi:hypothetical protein
MSFIFEIDSSAAAVGGHFRTFPPLQTNSAVETGLLIVEANGMRTSGANNGAADQGVTPSGDEPNCEMAVWKNGPRPVSSRAYI